MRWIVLALSLGAAIVSIIHGALAVWNLTASGGATADGVAFTLMMCILLLFSSVISLVGGILAFNRRRMSALFIIAAALLCIFIHPTTRVYGYVLLAGGLMAFFVNGPSDYYEEDDDEYFDDDGPYDEDYEEAGGRPEKHDDRRAPVSRPKERASRINLDREEYSLSNESTPKPREQGAAQRVRPSKVCPSCGASVGSEHKFCHTCGAPLQVVRQAQLLKEEDTVPSAKAAEPEILTVPEAQKPEVTLRKHEIRYEGPSESGYDEVSIKSEITEEPSPHRVFVKSSPVSENEDIFKAPLIINPDDSYQEFSNYTRRRKRKHSSLVRRVVGPFILLLAVAGAAWMLLSNRQPNPVPPPESSPLTHQEPTPLPPAPPPPEPTMWELLTVENPTRGIVKGSGVNIRPDHSTAGQAITRLNTGAQTDVLGQWTGVSGSLTGTWFNIRVSGRDGWIFGQYFQPLDGRQATLPPGYTDALLNSFGTTRTELTAGPLGQPSRQTPTTITWQGLTADASADGAVTRLQLTGPSHILPNGVAVGMTEEALYKAIGYPSEYADSRLRYIESAGRGMAVRLQSGRIQNITVGNI